MGYLKLCSQSIKNPLRVKDKTFRENGEGDPNQKGYSSGFFFWTELLSPWAVVSLNGAGAPCWKAKVT